MERTAVVLGRAELISDLGLSKSETRLIGKVPYLLDGSLPLYCRARRSGSYLTLCADAGSLLAKVVSSKSCASWAAGASVEAYRRHCDFEACDIDPVCTLKRLRNEAVTSCNAIPMLYLLHLTSSHQKFTYIRSEDGSIRTVRVAIFGYAALTPPATSCQIIEMVKRDDDGRWNLRMFLLCGRVLDRLYL